MNGNAYYYGDTGLLPVVLTPSLASQAGSTCWGGPLATDFFTMTFLFKIDQPGAPGVADGMTFMVHTDPRGSTALGGTGGSLGYAGITPSVAFRFGKGHRE